MVKTLHTPLHIFLVEDEEAHVELLRRAFESWSRQVQLTVARNLAEARTWLATASPDLMILDYLLPDGKGLELLPGSIENALFPTIIMTGSGDEHVTVQVMRAGALDYVVKSEMMLANMPHITERALREWTHITTRKAAEEMVRKKQTELAHIMRLSTLSEMASGLTHELNQPLSAIMTYVEICKMNLRSATDDRDELLNDLERIATLVERMAEIIGRLRDFVRKRETRQTPVDLNKLVQDVIRFVDHELRSGEAKLRLDLETALPDVLADAIQIQQVILNLVLNALEAMVDCPVSQRELTVRTAAAAGDVIEVAVCDTGSGVPPESTDRLFEPFFTSKPDGVGMGLSISKAIIEAHGGLLTAMPNSDRGMTFAFTLKKGKAR